VIVECYWGYISRIDNEESIADLGNQKVRKFETHLGQFLNKREKKKKKKEKREEKEKK